MKKATGLVVLCLFITLTGLAMANAEIGKATSSEVADFGFYQIEFVDAKISGNEFSMRLNIILDRKEDADRYMMSTMPIAIPDNHWAQIHVLKEDGSYLIDPSDESIRYDLYSDPAQKRSDGKWATTYHYEIHNFDFSDRTLVFAFSFIDGMNNYESHPADLEKSFTVTFE